MFISTGFLPPGYLPVGYFAETGTPTVAAAPTVTVAAVTVSIPLPAGPALFQVYKDGSSVPVATGVSGASYQETVPADGATHMYQFAAEDSSGNPGPLSVPFTAVYQVPQNSNVVSAQAATVHPFTGRGLEVNPSDVFELLPDGISIIRATAAVVATTLSFDVLGGYRTNGYDASGFLVTSVFTFRPAL